MIYKLFVILIFTTVVSVNVQSSEIKIGDLKSITSKVLNEKREYWVSLPDSYKKRGYKKRGYKKYPVLYFFDADFNSLFHAFTGIVKQLSSDASPVIPEMIMVGIVSHERLRDSSPTHSLIQYGGTKNEALDVSGGADRFIRFLTDELIPTIDKNYSTADYRILAGYSFTGLPVIQSLYTTPETFNAYIAIDPSLWWDDGILLKEYEKFHKNMQLEKRRLFIATSERVADVYPKENYVTQFINLLNEKPKAGLHFNSVTFGLDENHHTIPIIGIYKGLRAIFEGYMIDDHARYRPAGELKSHFERVSEKLGATFYPREGLINFFGYDRLYNDQFGIDVDRAIEFFKINTEFYPESANVWDSLGEAYFVRGDKEMAIKYYKKSLSLNPNNKNAKEKLKQLETI